MRTNPLNIACALLLAALLAACSDASEFDTGGSGTIRFSGVATSLQTRADEVLPDDYSMWVQAIHHVDDGHYVYFQDGSAEFACTDGVWSGRDCAYRYPITGTMDFVAYALHDRGCRPAETFTIVDGVFTGVTLDFADMLDGTQDILYSDLISGDNKSADIPLPLRFRHALSKIQFMMRAESSGTASALILYRLTLKGVQTSGKLQITPAVTSSVTIDGNTVTTGSTAVWTWLYSAAKDIDIYNSANGMMPVYSTTAAELGKTVYLPTQASGTFYIEIEYSIRNPLGSTTQHLTKIVSLGAVNWQPSLQYTYTLIFSLEDITIECNETGAIVDAIPEDIDIDEEYDGTVPINNN